MGANRCGRIRAWFHCRRREADRRFMVPLLAGSCESGIEAVQAFALFVEQPGQEHWRCDCGATEHAEVMECLATHG